MTNPITRTQWFDSNVKPVRIGMYERDYKAATSGSVGICPDYWDGQEWRICPGNTLLLKSVPWRGIVRSRGRPRKSA